MDALFSPLQFSSGRLNDSEAPSDPEKVAPRGCMHASLLQMCKHSKCTAVYTRYGHDCISKNAGYEHAYGKVALKLDELRILYKLLKVALPDAIDFGTAEVPVSLPVHLEEMLGTRLSLHWEYSYN